MPVFKGIMHPTSVHTFQLRKVISNRLSVLFSSLPRHARFSTEDEQRTAFVRVYGYVKILPESLATALMIPETRKNILSCLLQSFIIDVKDSQV